eukprot:SAG11_NODE_7067_length_1199_cov_1.212727_2_plen_233_part_00
MTASGLKAHEGATVLELGVGSGCSKHAHRMPNTSFVQWFHHPGGARPAEAAAPAEQREQWSPSCKLQEEREERTEQKRQEWEEREEKERKEREEREVREQKAREALETARRQVEIAGLRLSELRRRCAATGASEEQLDAATDAASPRVAFVALLRAAELDGLRPSELRQRCAVAGVSEAAVTCWMLRPTLHCAASCGRLGGWAGSRREHRCSWGAIAHAARPGRWAASQLAA